FSQALAESRASVAVGEGRVVLVSGEAGIGKSALVRSFCDAHRDAARVLWGGACDALGTPRPLSALTDIAVAVRGPLLSSVARRRPDGPASACRDVGNLDRRTVRERVCECVHAGGHPCLVAGPDSRCEGGRHDPVAVPALRATAIDDDAVVAAVRLLG
ncbi:MAG: AAA family ATPase, partial [Actinomycetota bacterium]|nr:AAA family ATPase [Actinomycetota bacterium]